MHQFDPERFGLAAEPDVQLSLPDQTATRALGARVAELMGEGGFVGLVGELGAGKTTFVQGLVGYLDPEGEASSPTYTLLNEYHLPVPVWHFDLYRLERADELETIAYWDYAEDPEAIVVVEWIDHIPGAWLGRGVLIELTHQQGARRAAIWLPGETSKWRAALSDMA